MSANSSQPTIFLLSGGIGASGEQIVYTVLAQFPDNKVQIRTVGHVRHPEQVTQAVRQAKAAGGLVVFTLVETRLREQLIAEAREQGVPAADLMGPMIDWLSAALGQEPLQQPGKYRQIHHEYFHRVTAIDFTLAHDDGKNKEGWQQAELVLLGVSRAGKTPLSVYLAVLGWKVANIPIVPQIPVPEELFALDPQKVIGLTMDPEQLLVYRRQRQARLGAGEGSDYTDLESIKAELQQARMIYRRGSFQTLNMTDKTIEQGADEIVRRLTGQTGTSWM